MTGQIKVGGTWRNIAGQFVKVSGSWHSVTSGWVKVAGVWRQWFVGAFSDTFARTTSGSLGTSSSGGTWIAIKGIWFANGTGAQSNDAPTNNSIATATVGSPFITATAQSVKLGTGIAFLVSDSNNWVAAVGVQNDTYNYNYNYSYGYNTSSTRYVAPFSYTYTKTYTYLVHGVYSPDGYHFATYAYYDSSTTDITVSGGDYYVTVYGYAYAYGYNAPTAIITTAYYLQLLQSVAGTVSTILSQSLTALANSLKVVVTGTTVTATAFSDNAQSTSVGSATYTLGAAPTANKHGIILTSSAQNQGYTVGYFSATITG